MKKIYLFLALIFISVSSFNAQAPTKGLIALYLLNGDAKDYSGKGNDGTVNGNCTYVEDRFGNDCGAMQFNGTDAYITVPDSKSLSSPSKEITISLWYKTQQGQDNFKWITGICKGQYSAETYNSPHYRLQVSQKTISVNTEFTEIHPFPFLDDHWYHYALVYDGNYVRTYLDGKKIFEFPYSGTLYPNDSPLYIARDIPGADEYFKGVLDEIRIYNVALSKKQIKKLYKDKSEKKSVKHCDEPVVADDDDTDNASQIDDNPVPVVNDNKPPTVRITSPVDNPFETKVSKISLDAQTKNVATKSDIDIMINKKKINAFDFNNNKISLSAALDEGVNTIIIKVKNNYGESSDFLIVNYKKQQKITPPKVNIVKPKMNSTAGDEIVNFKAKVRNVSSKNQISLSLNGNKINKFSFSNNIVTAKLKLEAGNNTIKITASNNDGTAGDEVFVKYNPPHNPPVITISNPASQSFSTDEQKLEVKAEIKNIYDENNLEIFFNGKKVNQFSFDRYTGKLDFTISLEPGQNIFIIKATNNDGSDMKFRQVSYNPVTPVPSKKEIGKLVVKDEVKLKSKSVKLICYDHNIYDGDSVTVYLNDKILFDKIKLEPKSHKKAVTTISLEPGKEYLIISKAWNEGRKPTNTLAIEISDGAGFKKVFKLNSHKGQSEALKLVYTP